MKTKKSVSSKRRAGGVKVSRSSKRAVRAAARRKLPPHKRILVHPATIFFLLCLGVLLIGLTYVAVAGNIVVTGKVSAPLLTEGAFITNPINGQTFTDSPITVSGTCPDNSYVNLSRNSVFSGSAFCVSNTFSIETSLSSGLNTLLAQDYNVTDDPGPVTPAVSVSYTPPVIPIPPGSSNGAGSLSAVGSKSATSPTTEKTVAPLLITSEYYFRAFLVGGKFSWPVKVQGGWPGYMISIDWGDGSTSSITQDDNSNFNISHVYKSAGYFPVKLQATDSRGNKAFLQLAALIKVPGATGFTVQTPKPGQPTPSPSILQWFDQWLWFIWPSYLIVLLMALSYWLGEREEYLRLTRFRYRRPARRHT